MTVRDIYTVEKTKIYYHRAYRKITGSVWKFLLELMCITVPLLFLFLFVYPLLTKGICLITHNILSGYFSSGTVHIIDQAFLLGRISFIDIPGKNPSSIITLINLIISLCLIIILPRLKRRKNIAIFFAFMSAINLSSALFFTISPSEFPYTLTQFSELYIKTQINMWLFLPFILGLALLLMPDPFLPKPALVLLTLIYSIVFGFLRYILFLFIVSRFSIIYIPILFFAFGPLIDFVYLVGIYSYYNSRVAQNLRMNRMVWKWSF